MSLAYLILFDGMEGAGVIGRNNRRLPIIYACAIGLILVVSTLSYFSFREISMSTDRITEQTYPMDHTVNRLLLAVVNQETGIRGYLLTEEESYLEPLVQANADLKSSKQLLVEQGKGIVQYQSTIQSTLASLEQVETLFGLITGLIEEKKLDEAKALLNKGKWTMDIFREQIRSLEQLLTSSMETAWKDQRDRAINSMEMIVTVTLVALIAILMTWYMFRMTKNALLTTLESERHYRRLVNNSPDAIAVHQDGFVVFANPACNQLIGAKDNSEIIGLPIMQFVHQPYMKVVGDRVSQAMNEKDVGALEEQFIKMDGSLVDVEVTAIGFPYEGRPAVLIFAREISIRKEAERKMKEANALLQRLSKLDGLTGIPNRRSFDEDRLRYWEEAQVNRTTLSLVLFDVDNFKAYNDYYGHQAGDACLQMVASVADGEARKASGTAYRYGGEEFAILFSGNGRDNDFKAAERIRLAIADCFIPHEGISSEAIVTISLGLASWTDTLNQTAEQWLHAADMALYEAKRHGRNSTREALFQANRA